MLALGVMLAGRTTRRSSMQTLLAVGSAAFALSTVATAAAVAAPVPCSPAGTNSVGVPKFSCTFWPAGDGRLDGTPVLAANGVRVGFLHSGPNVVLCWRTGGTLGYGRYYNNHWAYTQADNRAFGWVNGVHARGGSNNPTFGGVPGICSAAAGLPPGLKADPAVDWRHAVTLQYMYDQIKVNTLRVVVAQIKELNAAGQSAQAKVLWYSLVRANAEMDHKPLLQNMFQMRAGTDDYYMRFPGRAWLVYYDIWSNIHYGYVGRSAGFTTATLIDYSHRSLSGEKISPGEQAADDVKIRIGTDLFDRYPTGLTMDRIQTAIGGSLIRLHQLDPGSVKPPK